MLGDLPLQSYPYASRNKLPELPAVYMVMRGALVLYVGHTNNVKKRFSSHTNKHLFEAYDADYIVCCITKDKQEAKACESFLLHCLKPELNAWPKANWRF